APSAPLRENCEPSMPPHSREHLNQITSIVIDTAINVHASLGPGLLESVYEAVLTHELRKRGLHVQTQLPVPVIWDEVQLEVGFRADMLVEGSVVLELKSVELVAPVHKKMLLTYIRLMDKRVGLLMNFGAEVMRDGITRIVNNF